MAVQSADTVLHLCFDLERNLLRCCAEDFCDDDPDHCQSPILPDGALVKGDKNIRDCLEDIDWRLKMSSKEEWERFFMTHVDTLTRLLFDYENIKTHYKAASTGRKQVQVIIEQCLPSQTHQILSSPLEFWADVSIPIPRKHPVIRRLRFPGGPCTVEEALRLNRDPLIVLFVEAEEPRTDTSTAEHYVNDMTCSLRTWWKALKYPEENLGIIRLDWSRSTEDNIMKLIQGDPQPYFDALRAEIEDLNWQLKETKEKNERDELERQLEDRRRQKPLIENILNQIPKGLIHWVGPMKYDNSAQKLLVLPIRRTSEQQPEELPPAKLAQWIREAKKIRWMFAFLTSYAAGELPTTSAASVDKSNLPEVIKELLGQAYMPSILAFLRPIGREAAKTLFESLYLHALKGGSLPQALLRTRRDLYDPYVRETCHYAWAAPILFQLPEREIIRQPPKKGEIAMDAQTALQLAAISSWLMGPFIKLGAEGFVKKVGEKLGEEFVAVAKSVLEKVSAGASADQPEDQLAQLVKDLSESDPVFSAQGQKLTEGVWSALSQLLNHPGVTPDDILRIYQYLPDDATKHGRTQAEQVNYLITYAHKPGKLVPVLRAIQDICPDLFGE